MGKIVGVIAAAVIGLALAAGATVTLASTQSPDKNVNFENPDAPNNANGVAGAVNYGTP